MIVEIALLTTVVWLAFWWLRRPKNVPPGPPRFPIVGSMPFFDKNLHLTMCKWQEQYGDTFSYALGNKFVVMLNNFDTVRQVFSEENTAGRDQERIGREVFMKDGHHQGLIFSQDKLWKEQRRFALSTLRDFGMGKSWLEDAILAEVDDLCIQIHNHKGQPYNPRGLLSHGVSNVICALIFGKRFSHSDSKFSRLTLLISEAIRFLSDCALLDVVPILKYFPGKVQTSWNGLRKNQRDIIQFLQVLIDEHSQRTELGQGEDFIDKYMMEAKSKTAGSTFTDFQLIAALFDLFAAGTETTSTTTAWALIFFLENPDVLKKVQEEMDAHIAGGEPIRMSDRALLPYTEATIMEIQRCASLVPLNVPHVTFSDMTIDGYYIPKGTILFTNTYFIHRDPRHWKNPECFDPTRFLDSQGKLMRPPAFMPFSIGKRSCLGEALAKMELWLFIANLVHRFNFAQVPGKPVSSKNYEFGVVLSPDPYEVIFQPRT